MADSEINENPPNSDSATSSEVVRVEERPEHGMKILQGLNKLKNDKILCDVTLIAEGKLYCTVYLCIVFWFCFCHLQPLIQVISNAVRI